MEIDLLWNELNKLEVNNEVKLEYSDINKKVNEDPTKLVTYFDGLFYALSIERMKQLAEVNGVGKLPLSYFNASSLKQGWKLIKSQMNCSPIEYNAATDYCDVSELKFKRDISFAEAQKAFKCLVIIARNWINQKKNQEGETLFSGWREEVAITVDEEITIPPEDKTVEPVEESKLLSMLRVLQSSSKESVVNADSFGTLRDYMHVERTIQLELEKLLIEVKKDEKPSLILLCGSVGDGKSHLLAFMKENFPSLLSDVIIHNDSTESFNPQQNSLEALEQVLASYDNVNAAGKSVIIAINLGVLHNFYRRQREAGRFGALCDFIDSCGIFDRPDKRINEEGAFKLLNFAETQPYMLTKEGAKSPFFLELFNKVTNKSEENPFYNAWLQDRNKGISSAAHVNYYLMQQAAVKESIVQSLIEAMIKQKVFISTRTFYNFLYEIVVPVNNKIGDIESSIEVEDMLPNLMYGHPDRSPLLAALNEVDPLKTRLESTDRLISDFMLSSNASSFVAEKLGETSKFGAWKEVHLMAVKEQQTEYSRLLIRHFELLKKQDYNDAYSEYVEYLYAFYRGNEDEIGELFELLEKVIYAWKGSPKDKFIFMDSPNKNFRMAVEIAIDPVVDEQTFASATEKDEVDRFSTSIRIGFSQKGEKFLFELDYQLYLLLRRVGGGYRPNRQDIQDALQFSEFHDKILKSADKTRNILLVHKADGVILEVKKPKFSKAKFEVEKVN
jgi:DNA phosphorothioation-dependent restriction protein DptF